MHVVFKGLTLWAGVALVAGVVLRFFALDAPLMWHDEVYTRIFVAGFHSNDWFGALYGGGPVTAEAMQHFLQPSASTSAWSTVLGLARDEPQHPPLYYLCARLWMDAFGYSMAALRTLSAVGSVLGLAAGVWLARALFDDRRVTLVALGFLAISPFAILYAQEAREYAIWGAMVLGSTAALLRAQQRAGGWRWAVYGLLTTLGLYTSLSHVGVVGAQVLFVILQARGRPTRAALAAAGTLSISAVLWLPWALAVWAHYDAFRASMAWTREIHIPTVEVLSAFVVNISRTAVDLWPAPSGAVWALIFVLVALLAWSLVRWLHPRRAPMRGPLLAVLVACAPIALLLVPDLLFGGIRSLSTRYFVPTLPILLIALAHWTVSGRRWRWSIGSAVWALALASSARNAGDVTPWSKGVSVQLPEVAKAIAPDALIIGTREQHHPGNLLALSALVPPTTRFHLLLTYEDYRLPPQFGLSGGPVFIYSPVPWFPKALEKSHRRAVRQVLSGQYLTLWAVD